MKKFMEENKNNIYSIEELIKNMLDSCKKYNYKEVPITKRELELVLSSLKMEEIYKKEIKELKEYMKNDIELTHKLIEEMKEYEIITLDDYNCVNIDLKNQRFVVRLNNKIQYPIIKQRVNGKIKYFIDMEGKNVPLDEKVTESVKSEINSYMRSGI